MNPTLNTIDVVVADIQASVAFYAKLGLDFVIDDAYPSHAGCDLAGGVHVMLDTEDARAAIQAPGWERPKGDPRTFLAFQFGEPAAVDAKYAEMVEAGHTGVQEPWDAYWGMRYATLLDPDGNGVDLYCPLSSEKE